MRATRPQRTPPVHQETPSIPCHNARMALTLTDQVRILVVDDEPNIVDVISMALRFEGFAVESAGTGSEAIAAVDLQRPQLIVLDVMLPDFDGFEVARRLGSAAPTCRSSSSRRATRPATSCTA